MSMSVTNSQRRLTSPTVTNSHRPVHAYQKLPEFAIKLQLSYTISESTDELFIFLNSK